MREGRSSREMRPVTLQRGYTEMTPGSVLIAVGKTRVLCTASMERAVPPWMRDSGRGWVTAEYSMLPGSGRERVPRRSVSGGRTKEIQRLIGRSLRAAVDLNGMGEMSVRVDCDVLQADGGTRTAAITGAWVALYDTFRWAVDEGLMADVPLSGQCAAVSVGVVDGEERLDLEYAEDAAAEVDLNVVMTADGKLIEVQGTAEGDPFDRGQLEAMLDLATAGITILVEAQREALGM